MCYYVEPRTRKYVNEYNFLSFARDFSNKYGKQLLDSGVDTLKNTFKKVVKETERKSMWVFRK